MSSDTTALAPQFDDLEQQHAADRLGMWVFLMTELLLFGGIITAYFAYRVWYAHDFEIAGGHLNVLIGGINTIVLLASSLTMALAVHAAHSSLRRRMLWCLALTALLGATFMVFKGIEYYTDYRDYLVPGTSRFRPQEWVDLGANPARVALMLMFYYIATGIHAVHLTVGIGLVGWLIGRSARLRPPAGQAISTEVVGLYWHFVDIVWIFLLPILYLTGTHTLSELHF